MMNDRIAHYEIVGLLGSGGMGDVFEASDTKLGRHVALKFLPQDVARDSERTTRLEREAQLLAALHHPRIASIFGLEEAGGRVFLVMELVRGETLAERIDKGPLPLRDALRIAQQLAEALEAAHDKGIVHRDLKPANIKITPEGDVKVLDFGLAKLGGTDVGWSSTARGERGTNPPPSTEIGTILGTPSYMAPEQAQGRPVDRRADIFAFGCVLYEMLTGRVAFEGDSAPEILSRVLQREVEWARVPPTVPPSVTRLLRLCLAKDVRQRRQSAGDVRIDLEQALNGEAETARTPGSRRTAAVAMGVALVALSALAVVAFMNRGEPPRELRVETVTPSTRQPLDFALSPDGRHIVFVAPDASNPEIERLYLRAFDETEARPIAGTEGAYHPFWSPDADEIAFFAAQRLMRVNLQGGPVQFIAEAPYGWGGAWAADDTILFAPWATTPLMRVPATGGEAVGFTKLDSRREQSHRYPSFLPDGRRFVFFVQGEPDVAGIYLGSLDGGTSKRLAAASTAGVFVAPDKLVYGEKGALVARRFDASREELTGDPVTVANVVGDDGDTRVAVSASATGMLAYRAMVGTRVRLGLFDRQGAALGDLATLTDVVSVPALAPDNRRVAFEFGRQGNRDVWIEDLSRRTATRFTTDTAVDGAPLFANDGLQIAFASIRRGTFDIWIRPTSGETTEQLLLEGPDAEYPLDWSQDGRFLLYQRTNFGDAWDLWALPMTGAERTPFLVAGTRFSERLGQLSPDGRFIAYETDESGRPEIVVQAFPQAQGRWQVSTAGGGAPRWSADGREIFFVAPDGGMMAAEVVSAGAALETGTPVVLFATHIVEQRVRHEYAVASDGRFLVNRLLPGDGITPLTLILNWQL